MHRSTILIIACVGFLVGVAVASFLVMQTLFVWAMICAGSILLLLRHTRTTVFGVLLLAVAVGVWRTNTVIARSMPLWEFAGQKQTVTITGYVDSDFEKTETGGRFTLNVISSNERVLVMGPDWIQPRQGQVYEITGKLQRPKSYEDFDYVSYLAKDDIHATMYFPKYSVPLTEVLPWYTRARLWIAGHLASFRLAIIDSIALAVPQPESGYLTGILVGAKGVVSTEIKDAFSRTGTSHIMAISGYNITIIASVMMLLLAPLGKRRAYWLAVLGIVLFTIMVGAGASVVRAAIMGIMAITAQRLGRISSAGTAMVFSAALMCWYNPFLLRWDVGFQLSFLAFAGIIYVQPLMWSKIPATISTTISAQVLVLPILLYTFNTLAIYTLPANALVLPLVPIAMALGFATAITGMVWSFLGALIAQPAWLIAAYQLGVVRFFASLPHAALEVHISVALLVALYAGLVAWLISVYRTKHA